MIPSLLLLACSFGTPRPQVAQESPEQRLLAILDEDGDGMLSPHEVPAVEDNGFDFERHDQSGDGHLDIHELRMILIALPTKPRSHKRLEPKQEKILTSPKTHRTE